MRYLLGTEADEMSFSADGVAFAPSGMRHAVDTTAHSFRPDSSLTYAVCGCPVLLWKDQPFDPEEHGQTHQTCIDLVSGAAAENGRAGADEAHR